jgi:histone-binding protein RBBP4
MQLQVCHAMCVMQLQVLRHTGSTSGLAWHPNNPFQLATTSEAGPVYVWDLKRPGDSCLVQTLTGHSKCSFSVAWSPLLPGLLLSGSDDATARVWDVQSGTRVALLLGHTTEVRALCWHPEVPWLVFTGRRQGHCRRLADRKAPD